jgi:hypothetical protein
VIDKENKPQPSGNWPLKTSELIEGTHYYKENGFWVFTELYHRLRGSCCKSGCRHCPYDYKKAMQ